MLPKFLIADNSQEAEDRIFVVHTEAPRCIIESDLDDFYTDQEIHWIDDALDGEDLEEFLGEAEVFFESELGNQEDLYDDEYGDDDDDEFGGDDEEDGFQDEDEDDKY